MTAEQERIKEICGWADDGDESEYRWVEAYADGRRPRGGIIVGNFNNMSRKHQRALERFGCELEWSDGGTECDDCGLWIQTEPRGFVWHADDHYHVRPGEILCAACWRTIWENEQDNARQRGTDAGGEAYEDGDLGPVRLYLSEGMAKYKAELQAIADQAAVEELRRLRAEDPGPPECSICRGRHGREIIHACE
jgi:hypothetical protein